MAKRKFLVSLAVALTALSQTSTGAVKNSAEPTLPHSEIQNDATPDLLRYSLPEKGQSVDAIIRSGEDLFKFVLHRSQDGQLMAAHESHYSHSSHQSHSSHYSSR